MASSEKTTWTSEQNVAWFIFLTFAFLAIVITGFWDAASPDAADLKPVDSADLIPGLVVTGRDRTHQVTMAVPTPNLYLEADESLHPSLSPAFSAQWMGVLSVFETGHYRFEAGDADISINGRKMTDQAIALAAGWHRLRLTYDRLPGPAQLQLKWESEHFPIEPVPSSALSHSSTQSVAPDDKLAEQGRYLVQELGCVNCHTASPVSFKERKGPALDGIGSRTKTEWLYKWLENPSSFRPDAVMPVLLDEAERRDVIAYLSTLKEAAPAARSGSVPAGAADTGRQLYGSLACAACHEQPGLSLDGLGSKTSINALAIYLKDPFRIDPSGRMPSFLMTDQEARAVATFLAESRDPEFEQPVQPGDSSRGENLVSSRGCLSCHELAGTTAKGHSTPSMDQLPQEGGCLEQDPAKGLPRYELEKDQRQAIVAFLRSYREHPDVSSAPIYRLYQSLQQLRCTSCHQMDHWGPSTALPEGVPTLTVVGSKLRTQWIERVLLDDKRVRSWLDLRMPHYTEDQVQPLASAFAKAAGLEPGHGPEPPLPTSGDQNRGLRMIGNNAARGGLACIRCHDWGDYEALAERAPQLINATERIRYDWFYRYILHPGRVYSGTSMPDHFTAAEREEADRAITSLWAALSIGKDLPLPDGLAPVEAALGRDAKPVPGREPIVVRCYMQEATSAAFAVGLPGGVSYCFDAAFSQLRYVWSGDFIDMAGWMLYKKGSDGLTPPVKVLGDIFYRSQDFPLRINDPSRVPKARFRGYRLIDHHPEFHYQVDGVDVFERIVATAEKDGIARLFRISRVDRPMWFVADGTQRAQLTSSTGRPLEGGMFEIPQGENVTFQVTVTRKGRRP